MMGAGETYLAAFVLALGMNQVAAGLVATLPMVVGALIQLASPHCVRRLGSHRRWVVLCAACQAASFLPLVAIALVEAIPPHLVFIVAAVYWAAGMATGPAWNTWMGTLVPVRLRSRFFATRTRLCQAGLLVGFVGAGVTLQLGATWGYTLHAFALVFLVAAVCRFLSAAFLARQSEPAPPNGNHRNVSFAAFFQRLGRAPDGALLLYLLAVQSAVQIAGPYFTPFMLKQLHFSYGQYVTLIAAAFTAKFLALPALGRWAHRVGPRRLLWVGGVGLVPLSGLWLVSNDFYYLLALQAGGGVFWAAYELAMFLLFIETIGETERTSVLTTFNFANAMANVAGSLAGGSLLLALGQSREVYLTLFAASSLLRLAAVALLRAVPQVNRAGEPPAVRTVSVRPEGLDDRPVLASLTERTAPAPQP